MPDPIDHLDEIARSGNAGAGNDMIACRDGAEFSVYAGGGTHSTPRPIVVGVHEDVDHPETWVEHDYPGPYTELDVMPYQPSPATWDQYEEVGESSEDGEFSESGEFSHIPVEMVRDAIEDHGGQA